MSFTHTDMAIFAQEAWGPLGSSVVQLWLRFNDAYFGGKLKPIPIVITHTMPFGRSIGRCCQGVGRTIALNLPSRHDALVADANTLLHEMIHQHLHERGESAEHQSDGWRREIMRLHKKITGQDIWAGKYTTKRINGHVERINAPGADGTASLTQLQISRWPHDCDIDLGKLR
jgi:hypothetical protein